MGVRSNRAWDLTPIQHSVRITVVIDDAFEFHQGYDRKKLRKMGG